VAVVYESAGMSFSWSAELLVNLSDGLDGLAAGISAIACADYRHKTTDERQTTNR